MSWKSGDVLNTSLRMRRLSQSIPSSYTIWVSGSTYYAECNIAGGTDYSSAVASTVFQNVFDVLVSGGQVYVRNGTYILTSPVVIDAANGISLTGESRCGTILNGRLLNDYATKVDAWACTIKDIEINGGVKITKSSFLMDNCYVTPSKDIYGIYAVDCHDSTINNSFIVGTFDHVDQLGGLCLEGVTTDISNWKISNTTIADCDNYLAYLKGGAGVNLYARDITFSSCYFHIGDIFPSHGIYTYDTIHTRLIGNTFAGPNDVKHDFIYLDGVAGHTSQHIHVTGNDIWGYTNGRYGINLGFADYVQVTDNKIKQVTTDVNVSVDATDNIFARNTIVNGTVVNAGTGTKFDKNVGYVTENSGEATITAGNTSIEVTHGLVATPTKMYITAMNQPNDDADYNGMWVSGWTDNHFHINILNALAWNVAFTWKAEVV